MSKETSEECLAKASYLGDYEDEVRRYGDLRANEERERIKAQCERDGCYQYLSVDQIRQEEREKVLAELRSEKAEVAIGIREWDDDDAMIALQSVKDIRRALAIAKQEGRDEKEAEICDRVTELEMQLAHAVEKAKAELHEVQSLIHRQEPKAHTMTCAVHGSRACDCGAMP